MTPSSSTQVLCAVIVLFVVLHPGYGDDGFDNTSMIADEYINNTSDEQSVDYRKNHSSEEDVSQMELESSGDDDFHAGVLIKMLADQNKYMFNMMKDRDDALKKLSQMECRQQTLLKQSEAHQKELDSTGIELQSVRTEMESIRTSLQTELQSTKRELESTKSNLQSTQIGLELTKSNLQSTQRELESTKSNLQSTQRELESTKSNLQSTETKLESTQTKLESTQTKLESTQTDLQSTKAKLLGDLVKTEKNLGSTYIHWGRRNCSDGNNTVTLVYSGILGGKRTDIKGSGTNALCMTLKPKYDNRARQVEYAYLHGSYYTVEGFKHSITCSVCHTSYPSTIMVPGTYTCPAGWIPQYTGHLVASSYRDYANEFLCIDGRPQEGEISSISSARFSMVKTNCAGLGCPPYLANEVVTCVVCSKQ